MLVRSTMFFFATPFAMAIFSLGCTGDSAPEPILDLPEVEKYEPPETEKTLVISVITAQDQELGFAVYAGNELNPESRFDAETEDELKALIASHIEFMTASNPALDTVLIECDGNVRSGDIETVKSGVNQSAGQSARKLFVRIQD